MDVTITIEKPPCGHIHLTYHSGNKSITRTYMLGELRSSINPESIEEAIDMVHAQIKKTVLDNPETTMAELKLLIETEAYKV